MQEVSGVCTSPFLDMDERKMALRARKVSGAFEKRAPGHCIRNNIIIYKTNVQLFTCASGLFKPSRRDLTTRKGGLHFNYLVSRFTISNKFYLSSVGRLTSFIKSSRLKELLRPKKQILFFTLDFKTMLTKH